MQEVSTIVPGSVIRCPWCGVTVEPIRVGGSDKCPACKQTVESCCEGEAGRENQPSQT